MTIKEIKTVCFVGAGTMGCFNSLLAGMAGYEAVVWDSDAEALARLPDRQRDMGALLAERGFYSPSQLEAGLSRIHPVSDPEEAAGRADLLSESVYERLDLKREVHGWFDTLCPPRTIMTTNTSNLLVSEIESTVQRGDRFAALHAHLFSGLFDIAGGPRTSRETLDILTRYVRSLGGVPLIIRKEHAGYLYNAMFGAFLTRAMVLAADGLAATEDIDRAWMAGANTQAGPFAMMDFIGLNVVMDGVTASLADPAKAEGAGKIVALLRPLVEHGDLGVKTGKGFYTYPDPAFFRPDFLAGKGPEAHLYDALFSVLATNGLLLVIDGYTTTHDVDRAWMIAQHAGIGPFGMIDRMGLDTFVNLLDNPYGTDRYPADNIRKLRDFLGGYIGRGDLGIKTGRGFYDYPDPAYEKPEFLSGMNA